MLRCDLCLPTADVVTCTDASVWGYGAVTKTLDKQAVLRAVKVSDRWRFSCKAEHSVVQLQSHLPHVDDLETLTSSMVDEGPRETGVLGFEGEFELPFDGTARGWAVIGSHQWQGPVPHIVRGEGKALFLL